MSYRYKVVFSILFFILFHISFMHAQQDEITGVVQVREGNELLPAIGANVFFSGMRGGTATDVNGAFKLPVPDGHKPVFFIVSYVGFAPDTVEVQGGKYYEITLDRDQQLSEIVVVAETPPTFTARYRPINRVTISERELQKAACCNLAESFETNAVVDVSFSDGVSGARQIQMLGLDGKYVQMGFENIPMASGLSHTYGLSHIPGPWLDNIHITKGSGSVFNGFESMTGQIMMDFKRPENTDEQLYINAYADHSTRLEGNLHLQHDFSEKWMGLLLMHGNANFLRMDMNDNGFMDMPLARQLNFMNRWTFDSYTRWLWQFGVSGLVESRTGGQMEFNRSKHLNSTEYYGIDITHQKGNFFSKLAYLFPHKPYKSIGWIVNATYMDQNAVFGLKEHQGRQVSLYQNLVYQTIINSTDHVIKTGASVQADLYEETYADALNFTETSSNTNYIVPGAFVEYTYSWFERLNLVAGFRADYMDELGVMPSPRLHFRYSPLQKTTLRLSAGRGWRIPYLLPEHLNYLATSREMILPETFEPEVSWNYGGSIIQEFKVAERDAMLTLDFYRTDFSSRWMIDWESSPETLTFRHLENNAYSNSFQAEVFFTPIESFDVKLAYKWDDVKADYNGEMLQQPFVPAHKALVNLSYATNFDRWQIDFTTQINGKTRLPRWDPLGEEPAYDAYSPVYPVFLAQITRRFRKFDLYVGGENLGNYKQHDPVIGYDDPFGSEFDATQIWGPVFGRKIYAGIRLTIN